MAAASFFRLSSSDLSIASSSITASTESVARLLGQILAVSFIGFFASVSDAAPQDSAKYDKYDKYAESLVNNYDANKDGVLNADEIKKMRRPLEAPLGDDEALSAAEISRWMQNKYGANRSAKKTTDSMPDTRETKSELPGVPRTHRAKRAPDIKVSITPEHGVIVSGGSEEEMTEIAKIIGKHLKSQGSPLVRTTSQRTDKPISKEAISRVRELGISGGMMSNADPSALMKALAQRSAATASSAAVGPDAVSVNFWLVRTTDDAVAEHSFDGRTVNEVRRLFRSLDADQTEIDHLKFNTQLGESVELKTSTARNISSNLRTGSRATGGLDLIANADKSADGIRLLIQVERTLILPGATSGGDAAASEFQLQTKLLCQSGKSASVTLDSDDAHWVLVAVATGGGVQVSDRVTEQQKTMQAMIEAMRSRAGQKKSRTEPGETPGAERGNRNSRGR
ncbi:MAG: hypothetical protein AAFN77_06990 [Planctomycetota bacterium]